MITIYGIDNTKSKGKHNKIELLYHRSKDNASENISRINITTVSQVEISWLNDDDASCYIMKQHVQSSTFEVSQDEISWLKDDAPSNILFVSMTFEVSQDEISWLNEDAPLNIQHIYMTFEVSQVEMSWLNDDAS
jgi:hypothetical protein